jgi:peptide/nickel transport system substrate-binding protein
MVRRRLFSAIIIALFCCITAACEASTPPAVAGFEATGIAQNTQEATPLPTSTPPLPSELTICSSQEPASLFLYADQSLAARQVYEALYDGPYDLLNYEVVPVILEKNPSLADGDVIVSPIDIAPGDLFVTADGVLANLAEGIPYVPAGCSSADCVTTYQGTEPVQVDQALVRFKLRQGLQWSDRISLTADDSVYAFEVARSFYPRVQAELLARTQAYQALDSFTIEWRGLPGYLPSQAVSFFFSPLPRHLWGDLTPEELLESDDVNRKPLGYGPYVIENWQAGDRLILKRNPAYFRAVEGLPKFEILVYRFVSDSQAALDLLLKGECDFLDENYSMDEISGPLQEALSSGRAVLVEEADTAWEHLDFGIQPVVTADNPLAQLFQQKEARQAFAYCLDRQRIADDRLGEVGAPVSDSYVPANHPLHNPGLVQYPYDPQAGAALLDNLGWKDVDGDPATPRQSQGVNGVADSVSLSIRLLSLDDPASQRSAEMVRESLASCGVAVDVQALPVQELLAAGPEGPVFGRQFQMVAFAWSASPQPPCFLFTTNQIPGPYPQYPQGWGGANAAGFTHPEFDRLCGTATNSLPEQPWHGETHLQAQTVFAAELPVIPLFWLKETALAQPDLCGLAPDASARSMLWNLENLEKNASCVQD